MSWLQVFLLTLILSTARLIFLYLVGDHQIMQSLFSDLMATLFIGLRFDLRAATIVSAPLLLIGLMLTATRYHYLILRLIPWYSFVFYSLAVLASIGNYFYFKTYNNHFDIFVFGLIEDDSLKVLNSIWLDYPVIIVLTTSFLVSLLLTAIIIKVSQKFAKKHKQIKTWGSTTVLVIGNLLLYLFLARGSLATFPLKQYHASVSSYEIFNKSTPNALLALSWAHKKHKRDAKFVPVSKSQYQRQVLNVVGQDTVTYKTGKNALLTKSPPNVIFALMESMGTNLLLEDNANDNNLLGALRKPFEDDFLFTRFLPGANTTIDSIAMMLFHSNVSTISQGKEQKALLTGSAFLPFKRSGYKVIYITGGSPTWRNLNYYMLRQGVDEFYSENDIKDVFPQADTNAGTWGVPDVYTFKFVEHILNKNKQPVMIMLLTQTNHSPYKVPADYKANTLTVSQKVMDKMSMSKNESKEILATYQYSANALGEFIQSIKANNDNTIIAATGDHRVRSYSIEYPTDIGFAYSVPFYLYIPKEILTATPYRYNARRVGSHRDIFPTLYAYSLSDSQYISLGGRNLLAEEDVERPVAFNESVLLTPKGVINISTPTLLYPWLDNTSLQVSAVPITNTLPELPMNYSQLQTLFINVQVEGFQPYAELARLNANSEYSSVQ